MKGRVMGGDIAIVMRLEEFVYGCSYHELFTHMVLRPNLMVKSNHRNKILYFTINSGFEVFWLLRSGMLGRLFGLGYGDTSSALTVPDLYMYLYLYLYNINH